MTLSRPVSRRAFLQLSAFAAASGVLLRPSAAFAAPGHQAFGVQLYMVRNLVGGDLAGVLRGIHSAGFEQVEPYWTVYSHPAPELKKMIADAGLTVPSGHFDYPKVEGSIKYAQQLGVKYMVCPMLPQDQWTSTAGFAKAAADFNRWGKAIQDAGMHLAFHNHDYEFKPQADGKTGWSTLMAQTDPHLVGIEMDCYWITQAGQDPLQMLDRYRDRIHLIHLKDRTAGAATSFNMDPPQHFTEIGQGTIHWKAIIEKARAQGIQYFFLDQDETHGTPLESMKVSYKYLRSVVS